jgi:glycosyltransferase involved in cell wall biosynthesis
MKTFWFVIPCYNEEEMLPLSLPVFLNKLDSLISAGKISPESKVALVNDGSKDKTWELIRRYHGEDPRVVGITLAHNRGHQNALYAGLMTARDYADVTVSIDADLQDDIDAVDGMVDAYLAGADIVFGVRSSRKTDTFFKRFTAEGFYKVMEKMDVKTVFNHADFRLMDKRALDALAEYGEESLFLRGIAVDIGFETAVVTYERKQREAGESKYPLKKMLQLALNGITSFSTKPLGINLLFAILSGCLFLTFTTVAVVFIVLGINGFGNVYTIDYSLFFGLLAGLFFFGTMLFTSLWIMGLYLGRTYMQSKNRPRYVIADVLYKK